MVASVVSPRFRTEGSRGIALWPLRPRELTLTRQLFVNSMSDLFHEKVPEEFVAT